MKNLIFSFLLSLLVISTAFAQSERNDYQKIDYIKVNQDQVERFVKLAQNELKSSYGLLIESGDLKSWKLYKVQYPGGEKSAYNFISIATASSMNALGDHFGEVTTNGFFPAGFKSNGKKRLNGICSLVKSELWKVENDLSETDTSAVNPSRYMTMDYMRVAPGKTYDYLMLEDEIAKPIHKERAASDRMFDWEVYSLIFPGGTDYGYNFATGNFFNELEHIEFGFTTEIIKATMGENKNVPELFKTIYDTRNLVKIELWELVDYRD